MAIHGGYRKAPPVQPNTSKERVAHLTSIARVTLLSIFSPQRLLQMRWSGWVGQ